jgi:hypothetical protein
MCSTPVHYIIQKTLITNKCTTQWLLYVSADLTFTNSTFCPHSLFMCFVWISEQTAIISLYSINCLVFITEKECIYCAVRTGSLNVIQVINVSKLGAPTHTRNQNASRKDHQQYSAECLELRGKKSQQTGENYKMKRFMICASREILLESWNQRRSDG